MKKWYSVVLSLVSGLAAQDAGSWAVQMPQTGLLPSYTKATYIGRMGERHGDSHLGMQDYTVNIPFTDPYRSHLCAWSLNIQGNATVTLLDVGRQPELRRNEMYDISLPITFIRPLRGEGESIMLTIMPHMAGDMVHTGRSWEIAGMASYSGQLSKTFSYTLGIGCSPRFADRIIMPYVSFTWQATPDWVVSLKGLKLSAMYKLTEKAMVGPGLTVEGGSWVVSTEQGQRHLRVRSLAAAVMFEYDFSQPGERKRLITASLGSTLITSAAICRRNAGHDSISTRHYKPGLLLSAGVDFRF